MKLPLKLFLGLSGIIVTLNLLLCGPSQVVTPGSGTETIGQLVDENGNAVSGAKVELFVDTANTASTYAITDLNGKYKFDSLPAGKYEILGRSTDQQKVIYLQFHRDSLVERLDMGTNTMYPPGEISGCINVGYSMDTTSPIEVYIPGTSFIAYCDQGSQFTMSGIPRGTYTVKIYNLQYMVKTISNVIVSSGKVTSLGTSCITLDVNPDYDVPQVRPVAVSSNESSGSLTINWQSVPVNDIAGYIIYRKKANTFVAIDTVKDTFYIDTVFKKSSNDTAANTFYYQLKAIDDQNNVSASFSKIISLTAYPPLFYRNQYEFIVENLDRSGDITNADTAVISASYINRKRTPRKIIWSIDSLSNKVCEHTIVSFCNTSDSSHYGSDTLKCKWNKPGTKRVYLTSLDDHGDSWTDSIDVDILDSLSFHPSGKWLTATPDSIRRMYGSAAFVDSIVYMIGGSTLSSTAGGNQVPTSVVEMYNTKTGKWSRGRDLPEKRFSSACATLDGKIYVFGGYSSQLLSTIFSFDTKTQTWTKCGNLPQKLCWMSANVYNGKILITGGMNEDYDASNVILQYDPQTSKIDTFAVINDDDGARYAHQTVIYNDKLFIIGGVSLDNPGFQNIVVFDLVSKNVGQHISLTRSRAHFAAWLTDHYLYVAGGLEGSDSQLIYDDFEYLDLDDPFSYWQSAPSLSRHLYGAASVVVNGGLFLIGGSTQLQSIGREVNNVEIYYP